MKISYTKEFIGCLSSAPKGIKRIYAKQENLFIADWNDPRLHVKKIINSPLFSFRVTIKYRVLFEFIDENSALFLVIGHRKDIYE
jgi:mRNA-degrading endonuclease RelE of RelBE toxin-antitoxin system